MPRAAKTLYALNRGIISRLGLARVDLDRTNMSAEEMTNWMPRLLGSMQLRAGFGHIDALPGTAKMIPFVFAQDDTAQLEFTSGQMRVRIDDELIVYPTVTAVTINGTFDTNLVGWTIADEAGAASTWSAGNAALLGTGSTAAILRQTIAVGAFANVEHALRIVVSRGPIILRVGSSVGGDEYVEETTLGTGEHSIAFTPAANFSITVMNRRGFTALLNSVQFANPQTLALPLPYAPTDFESIRRVQSANVIFMACKGFQQRRVERRGARSWSVVLYESETGPFRGLNKTPILMAPTALTGDIHLGTNAFFFKPTHVGALFRIESNGQSVTATLGAANVFTNPIRVTGVGATRQISIVITGVFVATLTLQYSVGSPGSWVDATTYAAPTTASYNDGLDNQEIFYRIGIKVGNYTSGAATAFLIYSTGSISGVARVTEYVNQVDVKAVVLSDFGSITATDNWFEGKWSDFRGWPSAVAIFESRLVFSGNGSIDGSISDEYEDFDDTFEGDAGPIARTIGEGPQERIPWLLALTQLLVGVESGCANVEPLKILGSHPLAGRSSSFDEPLTPTNFNLKTSDASGMYVDTSRTRLLEAAYKAEANGFTPDDMTVAVPDLNEDIRQIVVQYKPDMRVWCRRGDGTAGVMIRDRAENLICWMEIETAGFISDISVMPGDVEDRVYFDVRRDLLGVQADFLEKMALESECRGNPVACLSDSFARLESPHEFTSTTAVATAHLEDVEVCIWGWNVLNPFVDDTGKVVGRDFGVFPDGSNAVLPLPVTHAIVGRAYTARWKSCKLAYAAQMGTAINVRGKVHKIGLVLADAHALGLKYGQSFDADMLDDMPLVEDEEIIDENRVWTDYDAQFIEFDGDWTTDNRICLQAQSPRPCTVLAVGLDITKSG